MPATTCLQPNTASAPRGEAITIDCLCTRRHPLCEMTITCTYREGVEALCGGARQYLRALYRAGLHQGQWAPCYEGALALIKRLKQEHEKNRGK